MRTRLRCSKCSGFTSSGVREEVVDIGEYYLNFLTGDVKIFIFCKKCSSVIKYKLFKFKEKIKHCCKNEVVYDKDLNLIEQREGFKLEFINSRSFKTIIQKVERKSFWRKDHKTWSYINLDLIIKLRCLDCNEMLNYKFNKMYRLFTFSKEKKEKANENFKKDKRVEEKSIKRRKNKKRNKKNFGSTANK